MNKKEVDDLVFSVTHDAVEILGYQKALNDPGKCVEWVYERLWSANKIAVETYTNRDDVRLALHRAALSSKRRNEWI